MSTISKESMQEVQKILQVLVTNLLVKKPEDPVPNVI